MQRMRMFDAPISGSEAPTFSRGAAMDVNQLKLALDPELSPTNEPDFMEISAVRNQVYQRIKRAILSGNLAPGTMLNFRSVADALSTSVMPVREAMHALAKEGAVEQRNNKSFSVIRLNLDEFRELKNIRLLLEGQAIRAAATKIDEVSLRRLEYYLSNMEKYYNTSRMEYLVENYNFHFLIYRNSRMGKLVKLIEMVWLQYAPNLSHFVDHTARKGGNVIHHGMIAGLRNRQPEEAFRALAADIDAAAEIIEKRIGASQ